MEESKFDFKFLNKVMYIGTFIVICFALKTFGILDKILELLAALTPFYIGVIICWVSKPLANKLRKMGIDDTLREMGAQEGDTVRILDLEFEYKE